MRGMLIIQILLAGALGVQGQVKSSFTVAQGLELKHPDAFGCETALCYSVSMPFLRGEGALVKDNNLAVSLEAALSPVTVTNTAAVSVTPIAFFKFGGSFLSGYGWEIFDSYGTGIHDERGRVFTKGVVMRGEIYAQLQIETKDIFNSDKLNFQAVAMQQCMHNSFSGAGVNESWIFQDDDGENFNGWSQGQLFFAGYEYPLSSDRYVTTGALLTTLGNLSNRDISPMDKGGWGSDFTKLRISPLVNVKVSKNLEWVVLFSFIRARVFSNDVPYFKMGEYRGTEFLYEKVQTQISYTFGRWGDWVK